MPAGIVHRGTQRALKHRPEDFIPCLGVADKICLQIMREFAALARRRAIHDFARGSEPCGTHDHRFTALPIDLALLDPLLFEMIQQPAGKQREKR